MGHSTSKVACVCGHDEKHQLEIGLLNGRIKHLEAELLSLRTPTSDAIEHTRTEHQEQEEEVSKAEDAYQRHPGAAKLLNSSRDGKSLQTFKQRKPGILHLLRKISQKETSPDNQLNADLANLRVIFQYTEDLESNLATARGHIEYGKKAFQEMEASLQFELEMERATSRAATANLLELEERIRLQEPLVKVGVAVRRRFIEQAKIFWSQNNPSSDEPDQSAIAAGNQAAHGGNVLADAAMFELELLDVDQHQSHFQRLYDIPWYDCLLSPPWNASTLTMKNFYGTMASYGAFNASSSMSKVMDLRFSLLWASTTRLLTNIKLAGYDEEFTLPLSSRKGLDKSLVEMRQMTEDIMRRGQASREPDRAIKAGERAKRDVERAKKKR